MRLILMAVAATGFIGHPAETERIKAALDALGCTAGKIEKQSEQHLLVVGNAKCKRGDL
jgi:hypothetical protein